MATKLQVWNSTMILKSIIEGNEFDSIRKLEEITKLYKQVGSLAEGYKEAIIKVCGEGVAFDDTRVTDFLAEAEDTEISPLALNTLDGIKLKGGDYVYLRDSGMVAQE